MLALWPGQWKLSRTLRIARGYVLILPTQVLKRHRLFYQNHDSGHGHGFFDEDGGDQALGGGAITIVWTWLLTA